MFTTNCLVSHTTEENVQILDNYVSDSQFQTASSQHLCGALTAVDNP